MRQELGVDVQLADAARDQLGELAAEVEDDDGAGASSARWCAGRSSAERSGRGRVERGLEVGLDLGVIGGEHAMAGVGRLAVDGLAAIAFRPG